MPRPQKRRCLASHPILPEEILISIFALLTAGEILNVLPLVSKRFRTLSLEALSCIREFSLRCIYTRDYRDNENRPRHPRWMTRNIFNIVLSNTFLQKLDLRGIFTPRPFFCVLNIKSLILDGSSSILRVCKLPFLEELIIRNDIVTVIPPSVKVLVIDKCKIRNIKFPDSLESIKIFESNGNVFGSFELYRFKIY